MATARRQAAACPVRHHGTQDRHAPGEVRQHPAAALVRPSASMYRHASSDSEGEGDIACSAKVSSALLLERVPRHSIVRLALRSTSIVEVTSISQNAGSSLRTAAMRGLALGEGEGVGGKARRRRQLTAGRRRDGRRRGRGR